MILQLLKKDCIIAKNYVAAVILIGVGLPVLLVWKQPQMLEVFALPGAVFLLLRSILRFPKRKICTLKQRRCFVPLLITEGNS